MNAEASRLLDALLIIRFQAGDDSAFDELCSRNQPRLTVLLRHRLGNDAATLDDLSQQIWLEAFRGLRRMNSPLAWEAWIGRIAKRQLARHFAARKRQMLSLNAADVPAVSESDDADEFGPLNSALTELGEPYQSMLHMRYWHSWTYQQIARHFSIPLGTVRSRLHWAHRRLSKILKAQERSHDEV